MRSASAHPDLTDTVPSVPVQHGLHWPTVALAFTSMFILMGSRSSFAVIYPAMVQDRGWSVSEVTSAYSSGLVVYALLAILVGVGVDRLGTRTMMLAGASVMALGLAIVSFASEVWQLYVGYVMVVGLGSCGIGFITQIKVLSTRNGARFATAFGLAFMGNGVGSLLVSPAVQLIIDASGWRTATLAYAIVVAAVLLPLAAWLAPGPQHKHAAGTSDDGKSEAPGALSVVCWIFLVGNMALGFHMLAPTHQVAYMLDLGFAATLSATAAGAWGAMMSVGSVGGGWLVDKIGLRNVLFSAVVLFSVGTAGLIVSAPTSLWLLLVYVLLGGAGRGLLGVSLGTAQTRTFAGPRLGRMTGILDVGFGTGAFLGPWGTAVIHDQFGTFAPGFLATIPAAVIGALCTVVAQRIFKR
ncbi:MAG: MFS transporter [Chloroflexota bacterium]